MVQSGFTRKKVASLTLGEKLQKLRGDFRMSLAEVSKATRIQVKYLEFLESGEYEKLPADVYVRGFLRSYARYLNVDEQALVRLYERERNIQENLGREKNSQMTTHSFSPVSIVITSRALVVSGIVLLVLGSFFYLYREFKSFAADPQLVILEPQNGSVIEAAEVTVRGKTDKGAEVTLNDQIVFVDNDGLFSSTLFLQPGINTVLVRTRNRFGKEKSVTFSLEARYTAARAPAVETPDTVSPSETFPVEVTARVIPVVLSVMIDGTTVFSGKLASGETKKFEVRETMSVTTDHGEATFVKNNGKEEQVLATAKGPLVGAVFLRSGRKE